MDKIVEGVILQPLGHIAVLGGDVLHALKSSDKEFCGFGEAYFSQIEAGAVKGWKRHNRITLNLIVPVGAIKFVIYDDREYSRTFRTFFEVILSPLHNYQRLTIAPGLWVAFMGMGESTSLLLDIIPELHDPNEADKQDLNYIDYNFGI